MAMQEAKPNTPKASPTERRSRKLFTIIVGTALVIILAAIGVYVMAFRSLPTTVSWAPSAAAIAPGGELTVSGRVTPAETGRRVSLESAPTAQGPWLKMPQSATTDSRGRFSITYKPQLSGSIVMRVVVDPAGRYLEVTGQPKPVRLLSLSSISLKGGGTIPTQTPVVFAITVDPASAGRIIRIEQSSDKVRWVPVGPSAKTKADGTAVVKVPGPAVGSWSYRATASQDDNYAAAVSPVVGATVEDIRAAAATYLRITNEWNAAHYSFSRAVTRANSEAAIPPYLRAAAAALSLADTKAAASLRAYSPWPSSVKPLIDGMITQYVISADNHHQLSAVTDTASWNRVMTEDKAANDEGARLSTLIRQALGLPQRAID